VVRGVKEADGANDAVLGLDQVVAVEAGQLAQGRQEAVVSLLDELLGAALVDRLVASNGGKHRFPTLFLWGGDSVESSWCAQGPIDSRGSVKLDDVGEWSLTHDVE
jgi:hypothetical protein